MQRVALVIMLILGMSGPVQASDRALIIDLDNYRYLPALDRSKRLEPIVEPLIEAGFTVTHLVNPRLEEMRSEIFALETDAQGNPGRTVVLLRGLVVTGGRENWLVAAGARKPDRIDVASKAIPISLFDRALAASAGAAVLGVVSQEAKIENLAGLSQDILLKDMPQGVTGVTGQSHQLRNAIVTLLKPGKTTADLLNGNATLSGFVSRNTPFSVSPDDPHNASQDIGEMAYWSAVRDIGTQDALSAYLDRYPTGIFADVARAAMVSEEDQRKARIRAAEDALNLSRRERQEIQRNLALLGYDPRGIDGVFGPATRRAVSAWQSGVGFETHGFLDRRQLRLLQEAALKRAAQLEEEARRRQEIQDERDRAFWQETGASGRVSGYRAYLERFPDGIFAEVARTRLEAIEAERRAALGARERGAWDNAEAANTIGAYREFLKNFPDGAFAETAQSRVEELERKARNAEKRKEFLAIEQTIVSSPTARRMVESRLAQAKLEPGDIDGKFDQNTRRALRKFQQSRNLTVTGFVDQPTMVRLLLGR